MTGLNELLERRHRKGSRQMPLTIAVDFVTMRSNLDLQWFP
jgi:hypothetical protein